MATAYSPPLEVKQSTIDFLRIFARQYAFCADMLRVIDRTGGLTENQLRAVDAFYLKAPAPDSDVRLSCGCCGKALLAVLS